MIVQTLPGYYVFVCVCVLFVCLLGSGTNASHVGR